MRQQDSAELFGHIADAIGADVNRAQAFEHQRGLGKRVLGRTEQGQQFIESSRARASAELELEVERMLTVTTGSAQIGQDV